jgi:hypothetical protein
LQNDKVVSLFYEHVLPKRPISLKSKTSETTPLVMQNRENPFCETAKHVSSKTHAGPVRQASTKNIEIALEKMVTCRRHSENPKTGLGRV